MKPKWLLLVLACLCSSSAACQMGCRCPSRETADCSGSNFKSIPLLLDPRTTRLLLDNNRIQKLSADELSIYPGLRQLSLANNSIVHVSADVFNQLHSLEKLDLSANRILTLPPKTFAGLQKLTSLDLSHNGAQVTADTFFGLRSLQQLSLSGNGLSYLPPSIFKHSPNLDSIRLDGNRLIDLPESVFSSLPKLRQLDVHSNLIATFDVGTFSRLHELQSLDMADNLIANIDDRGFEGLANLTFLNLTNNQLVRISGSMWPLPRLQTLDLSGNLFMALETASFDNLPALRSLNLSNSRNLKSIHMSAFVALNSLRSVSFANSQLSTISNTAFAPPPPLSHLDLSNNQLFTLPPNALPYNRIRTLRLDGNPLDCDCALREISLPIKVSAVCAGPSDLAGTPLSSLSQCSPLRGLVVPFALAIVLLVLAMVTLLLAIRKPASSKRKASSSLLQNSSSLLVSQEKYGFDRPLVSPSSTGSPQSQESFYEAPNATGHLHLPYAPQYRPSMYTPLPSCYTSSRTASLNGALYKPVYRAGPLIGPLPPPPSSVIPPLGQGQLLTQRPDSGDYENDAPVPSSRL